MTTVDIILDGQYGSCGKGAYTQWLARKRAQGTSEPYRLAIRTGGPNAGHSVITPKGRTWAAYWREPDYEMDSIALRHVPAAAVTEDLNCLLVLPPAALVNIETLLEEVELLDGLGYQVSRRLMIDPLTTVITHDDEHAELDAGMREAIGSTREGVGAAQARKIMRTAKTARDFKELQPFVYSVFDRVWDAVLQEVPIQIEMTQGMGLSLHWGHYPFATSRDITPAQAMNDAGLSPTDRRLNVRTHLLARSYPIRVAGNSGPFGLPGGSVHSDGELSWEYMQQVTGGYVQAAEKTTVTKLPRRIASWDGEVVLRSAQLARPQAGVLMFADYVWPRELLDVTNKIGVGVGNLGWAVSDPDAGVDQALAELTFDLWREGAFEEYRMPFRRAGSDLLAVAWGYGAIVATPAARRDRAGLVIP